MKQLEKTKDLIDAQQYRVLRNIETLLEQTSNNVYQVVKPVSQRVEKIFNEPLKLAILGEYNAGKSSFINRFLGAKILPIGPTPKTATAITLMFYDNPKEDTKYKVESIYERSDGSTVSREEFAKTDEEMYALLNTIQGSANKNKDINYSLKEIKAYMQNDILKNFHIMDTPGLNDTTGFSSATENIFDEVNYILWLFTATDPLKATEKVAMEKFLRKTHYANNIYAIINKGDTPVNPPDDKKYKKTLLDNEKALENVKENFVNKKLHIISTLKSNDEFWNVKFDSLINDLTSMVLRRDSKISANQLKMEVDTLNINLIDAENDLSSSLSTIDNEFKLFFDEYIQNNIKRIQNFKNETLSMIKKSVKTTEIKVRSSTFYKTQYRPTFLKFASYYYTALSLREMKENIEKSYKEYIEEFEKEFNSFRKKLKSQQVKNEKLRDIEFRNSVEKQMDELTSNLRVKKNSEQLLIVGYIIGLLSDDYIYNIIVNQERKEDEIPNINDDPIINLLNMDLDMGYFIEEINKIEKEIAEKFTNEIDTLGEAKNIIKKYKNELSSDKQNRKDEK